jgi:hypothetical protein
MRFQGVDRFIIYDDGSTDNVTLLQRFYRQRDPGLYLLLLPRIMEGILFGGQEASLQHCMDTYGNSTEWVLLLDTDENLYSPSHGTLKAMLEDVPRLEREDSFTMDSIYADCYRFGSSGRSRKFQYDRLAEEADGTVTYRNPCGGRDGEPQLMINQVRRGPHHQSHQSGWKEEEQQFKQLIDSPA